jgi:Tol biopolymer transport system component/DNA-binding winged helix-turn-helix (wHTH) protein
VVLCRKQVCRVPVNQHSQTVIRFGAFEANLQTQEVRNQGMRLRLPGQSFQVLRMLLEHPGELVSRDELHVALWPSDTFVDFEHGLNAAVNRLREALGDSADTPHLIETLPRRGYRFIGAIKPPLTTLSLGLSEPAGETSLAPPLRAPDRAQRARPAWLMIGIWFLMGTAVALATVFGFRKVLPHSNPPALTAVPFTAYPGQGLCPTFSPDGSQIAFAWDGDPPAGSKGFDLYVKVVGSENLLRLTRHPADLVCPAWSPDGAQIAFHRFRFLGPDTGLYVVPALGGPERKLRSTHIVGNIGAPISWSPDGKWIAFVDRDTTPQRHFFGLNLLSVETLEITPLPHAERCLADHSPAFSHSGKDLAYGCIHSVERAETGIYTVPTIGGTPKLVTTFTGWTLPGAPAWTRDDKKLIFSHPHFGLGDELNEITIANGSLRRLEFANEASSPTISAKGDKLAYVRWDPSGNRIDIWRRDLRHPQAPAEKLISSTYEQSNATYSPDGKHIAFESTRSGSREIWIADADGTRPVQISHLKALVTGTPRWSPDSQKIVFDSRVSESAQLYVADIFERVPRRVETNLSEASAPSWSRDGNWIYFQSDDGNAGGARIYRCPSNGGDAISLSSMNSIDARESVDGAVYFEKPLGHRSSLYVRPASGAEQSVQGIPYVAWAMNLWTIVPQGIYFVPADASRSLRYFDFKTKTVRQTFELDKEFSAGLSVSPDGHWMLYSEVEGERNTNVMLVDHFE